MVSGVGSAGDDQWSVEWAVLEMISGQWSGQRRRRWSVVSGVGSAGDDQWSVEWAAPQEMVSGQ